MKKSAIVVGGTSGIGLAVALELKKKGYDTIIVMGREKPPIGDLENIEYKKLDLAKDDLNILKNYLDIDALFITAGIGRVGNFVSFRECEIDKTFNINTTSIIKILSLFSNRILSDSHFTCAVVTSIAGLCVSPLFAVYSATKAALCRYIEAVNIEIEAQGFTNRITNIAPGYIKGTSFYGERTDISKLKKLANCIISVAENSEEIFIPDYESIYKKVLDDYKSKPREFGLSSYRYKKSLGRVNDKSLIKIGYLSGTFDLFHIGHLNLLKRAKHYCDYLVVGVHKDASHKGKETFIPFEERKKIVASIDVVDRVIDSFTEDSDAWNMIKYDYLFVGSDYKGSERFNRYEEFFKDKGVQIIYFPYTQGTSSSKLREALTLLK